MDEGGKEKINMKVFHGSAQNANILKISLSYCSYIWSFFHSFTRESGDLYINYQGRMLSQKKKKLQGREGERGKMDLVC